MAQIKTGTVSVTNGNNVVTGSGTSWLADGVQAGDGFVIQGEGIYYTIASVSSDTSLMLSANYGGSTDSGAAYVIYTDFIAPGYPALLPGDLEVKSVFNRNVLKLVNDKANEGDLGTAAEADLTTSSTDTTADRVLKVGDGGLLESFVSSGLDLNVGDYIVSGIEVITQPFDTLTGGTTGLENIGGARYVISSGGGEGGFYQLAFARNKNSYFIRSGTNLSMLGDASWVELYHTGNILGAVSESGGVPTGAIIERGSNSDGEYVKFADGTLICSHQMNTEVTTTNAHGPLYISPITKFNFPVNFNASGGIHVVPTGRPGNGYGVWSMLFSDRTSSTSGFIGLVSGIGNYVEGYIGYTAYGRWY